MDKILGIPGLANSIQFYDQNMYKVSFTEVDIYDGDTIEHVKVHVKEMTTGLARGVVEEIWPGILLEYDGIWARFNLRINGIDTPEVHPRKHWPDGTVRGDDSRLAEHILAFKARDELIKLYHEYDQAYISDVQIGKYASRLVAKLVFGNKDDDPKDYLNYAKHMINLKLAHPYGGGTKPPWGKQDEKTMAENQK